MFKLPEWKYLRYKIQQRWHELTASKRKPISYRYKGNNFWHNLEIRKRLATHPWTSAVICVAAIFLFLSIAVLILFQPPKDRISENPDRWFYDLNTGELFIAKKNDLPPIEAPSGPLASGEPAGVLANVFCYGKFEDESAQFIGFLEMLTPQAKAKTAEALKSGNLSGLKWGEGRLIRKVEDEQWVQVNSKEGRVILQSLFRPNKQGQLPRYCHPK